MLKTLNSENFHLIGTEEYPLSASTRATLGTCGYQFVFNKNRADKTLPHRNAIRGSIIHDAIDSLEKGAGLQDVLTAVIVKCQHVWDCGRDGSFIDKPLITDFTDTNKQRKNKLPQIQIFNEWYSETQRMIEMYYRYLLPLGNEWPIILSERKFEYESDGIINIGFVDQVRQNKETGELLLIDIKTGEVPVTQFSMLMDIQWSLYYLAMKHGIFQEEGKDKWDKIDKSSGIRFDTFPDYVERWKLIDIRERKRTTINGKAGELFGNGRHKVTINENIANEIIARSNMIVKFFRSFGPIPTINPLVCKASFCDFAGIDGQCLSLRGSPLSKQSREEKFTERNKELLSKLPDGLD